MIRTSKQKIWYTTLIGFETYKIRKKIYDAQFIWYTTLIGFETIL